MILSPALPEDASALALVLGDWVRDTPFMPRLHSRDEDLDFLDHLIATSEVTVAREPQALGFLARQADAVLALYLAPPARRRGIGRALMARAKSARPRLTLWCFQANLAARAFYAAEGFREVARTTGDNEEGLPDVRFEWQAPNV